LNTGKVIFNDTRVRGFWLYKWYQIATMQEKQAAFGQVIPLIVNGTLRLILIRALQLIKLNKLLLVLGKVEEMARCL